MKTSIQPRVAVVILNWNGQQHLANFLPSVLASTYTNLSIIVGDNASTDTSVAWLQEVYPQIKVIENDKNYGFAGGYNQILAQVDADYFVLLNSDVEVTPDWIEPVVDLLEKNPYAAAAQPKILSYADKKSFEYAGAAGGFIDFLGYPFCRGRIFDTIEKDYGQYEKETEIFWASGAALFIKKEAWLLAGGFDESLFAHMEEIDLCWRLKRKGHRIKVVPSSVVYHVGGGTLDYMSPQKTYLNFRNSLLMITKNHDGNVFMKIFYRLILDGMAGLLFFVKGSPRHTYSVLRAHFSYYRLLTTMLKKRSEMKETHTQFNKEGVYRGSILWAKYVKKIHRYAQLNLRLFSND
jgi:hypothetical protein